MGDIVFENIVCTIIQRSWMAIFLTGADSEDSFVLAGIIASVDSLWQPDE